MSRKKNQPEDNVENRSRGSSPTTVVSEVTSQPSGAANTFAAPLDDRETFSRRHLLILLGILLFALFTRVYRISEPQIHYYDEVYFGFSAEQLVLGNKDVYDPYAKSPPGFAHEWTHPPLGKILISYGVRLFGLTPFGRRVSSVVFGLGIIIMSALIAHRLFRNAEITLLTAFFMSLDGLLFVQSRVAMIDVHVVFFMLCAFYFYLCWKSDPKNLFHLFGVGLGIGLSTATKWNAAFLAFALGIDILMSWLIRRELPKMNWAFWFFLFLVIVPVATYLWAYIEFFSMGYNLDNFTEHQRQMYWYHANLKTTHSSSSEVHQWLLNSKPAWLFAGPAADNKYAVIYNLGNHVIHYSGLFAIGWSMVTVYRKWNWETFILLMAYALLFIPWALSPRIKFYNHYLPAVPFLVILLSNFLYRLHKSAEGVETEAVYVKNTVAGASVLWFICFYPYLTAVPLRKALMDIFRLIVPAYVS